MAKTKSKTKRTGSRKTPKQSSRTNRGGAGPAPIAIGQHPLAAEAARRQAANAYDSAEALWNQILAERPDDYCALYHLGVLHMQKSPAAPAEACAALKRVCDRFPQDAAVRMHYGLALKQAGDPVAAEGEMTRAIDLKPDYAEAHNNLGVVLNVLLREREARACFAEALRLKPGYSAAQRNLAALTESSDDGGKRLRAEALARADDFPAAIEIYRELVDAGAKNLNDYYALAECYRRIDSFDEAARVLEQALSVDPGNARTLMALAQSRYDNGACESALAALAEVPQDGPESGRIHHLRANIYKAQKLYDLAREEYERALVHRGEDARLHNDYSLLLQTMNLSTDSSMHLLRSIQLDPNNWQTYNNLANVIKDQGNVLESIDLYERAIELAPKPAPLISNLLLTINYVNGLSNEAVYDGHKRFAAALSHIVPKFRHANACEPDKRLRVGYVSADFRGHSVAYFFWPLLTHHDRSQVEVFLYSNVKVQDEMTSRIRAEADHWRAVHGLQAAQIADMIADDGIDILIDLSGHTGGNLLDVFQHKPAPLQVSWLGYPNTTGLETIDYRIVDDVVEPEGEAEAFSSEQIVRLPDGFHCMSENQDLPDPAPAPHLTAGHVQFGSFNYLAKVNEQVIAAWAEILRAVPDSRMMLKARGLGDTLSNDAYMRLFERYGVSRNRIDIVAYQPTAQQHLGLYNRIDIALDTFPYNGTTTTCEALSMSVPVVAMLGHNHCSRVSASLLKQVGLVDLVASDPKDYVAKAVALARDSAQMSRLRAELPARLAGSPLRDEAGFAKKFEQALRHMWHRHCASQRVSEPA